MWPIMPVHTFCYPFAWLACPDAGKVVRPGLEGGTPPIFRIGHHPLAMRSFFRSSQRIVILSAAKDLLFGVISELPTTRE
jgi:hypothetical protein